MPVLPVVNRTLIVALSRCGSSHVLSCLGVRLGIPVVFGQRAHHAFIDPCSHNWGFQRSSIEGRYDRAVVITRHPVDRFLSAKLLLNKSYPSTPSDMDKFIGWAAGSQDRHLVPASVVAATMTVPVEARQIERFEEWRGEFQFPDLPPVNKRMYGPATEGLTPGQRQAILDIYAEDITFGAYEP